MSFSRPPADCGNSHSLKIVRYSPASRRGDAIAPRGSVVVYLAAAGSERLAAIHQAARGGAVHGRLLAGVDEIPQRALSKVTVSYGGKVLAAEIPVPADGSAVRLILPYNGGELVAEDLQIRADDGGERVAALAVVHAPPLSRVEEAALALVPQSALHLNLGVALPGGIAGINDEERRRAAEDARQEAQQAAGEARAEAAAARAEARAERAAGGDIRQLDLHLLDQSVVAMGPALAAAEMLELRRDLLKG